MYFGVSGIFFRGAAKTFVCVHKPACETHEKIENRKLKEKEINFAVGFFTSRLKLKAGETKNLGLILG